jgi:hypothetical protein
MPATTFIADYPYQGASESELTFAEGETIEIISCDSDWWYGQKSDGSQGWFSPAYGHTNEQVAENPFSNISEEEKAQKKQAVFNGILQIEGSFVGKLEAFTRIVVNPLSTLDTQFKRNFLADPSIAVSLNLLKEIYTTCKTFLNDVKGCAGNDDRLASTYSQFTGTLQLFARYASENAACLNSVKSFGRQLREFSAENPLPDRMTVEAVLVLPLEHYSNYLQGFQEYVWLTSNTNPAYSALNEALASLTAQTELVDDKLNEIAASVRLLSLQSQCE